MRLQACFIYSDTGLWTLTVDDRWSNCPTKPGSKAIGWLFKQLPHCRLQEKRLYLITFHHVVLATETTSTYIESIDALVGVNKIHRFTRFISTGFGVNVWNNQATNNHTCWLDNWLKELKNEINISEMTIRQCLWKIPKAYVIWGSEYLEQRLGSRIQTKVNENMVKKWFNAYLYNFYIRRESLKTGKFNFEDC